MSGATPDAMAEGYAIDHDAAARLLTITTAGFWSVALTTRFAAELLAKGTALRLRHGAFYTLVDMRAAPIQSGGVIDTLAAMMPRALQLTTAPIAAVAGSNLGKMQTERYLRAPNCRTFLDIDEARAWMLAVGLPK
ncbi:MULTISPECIES: hypothetical protein [unclassified Sphingomonas]|jgi:hypothetical protein|uniref:hypothetical protein n=1 Tax=unclassified Sphingomonas TaxID=196159 RepID=UPI000DBBFB6C|nr:MULTISPECIES: hypothetical protein [unclassified Sphingomonas]PZT91375.1 MAG: hypothetical protein DI625_15735 [Sphingomonas sp.]RSV21987.1 hypothetical protein CA237_15795 [Sphingomonas sp. ABOLH]